MFIVDDLLLFPCRGIRWIFQEIHRIAEEELTGEAERLRDALTDLYMQLETGWIDEETFEAQEQVLLDRLDAIEAETLAEEESDAEREEDGS